MCGPPAPEPFSAADRAGPDLVLDPGGTPTNIPIVVLGLWGSPIPHRRPQRGVRRVKRLIQATYRAKTNSPRFMTRILRRAAPLALWVTLLVATLAPLLGALPENPVGAPEGSRSGAEAQVPQGEALEPNDPRLFFHANRQSGTTIDTGDPAALCTAVDRCGPGFLSPREDDPDADPAGRIQPQGQAASVLGDASIGFDVPLRSPLSHNIVVAGSGEFRFQLRLRSAAPEPVEVQAAFIYRELDEWRPLFAAGGTFPTSQTPVLASLSGAGSNVEDLVLPGGTPLAASFRFTYGTNNGAPPAAVGQTEILANQSWIRIPLRDAPAGSVDPSGEPDGQAAATPGWFFWAGLGAVGLMALPFATPTVRYAAFRPVILPFYSRVAGPQLLDQRVRNRLHDVVRAEPGIHLRELQRRAEVPYGAAVYHLGRLERDRLLVSRREGLRRCFYTPDAAGSGRNPRLPELQRQFLDRIRARRGVRQADLAHGFDVSPQLVSYHVRALVAHGYVLAETTPEGVRLHPSP